MSSTAISTLRPSDTAAGVTLDNRRRRLDRSDRLTCRIDPQTKQRAEAAASLLGQNLTAFTESALNEKSTSVFEREECISLSARDWEKFAAAVNGTGVPQVPNERLKSAVAHYQDVRRDHPELNW